MAQCRAFLHLIHKCNWCGATNHESHLCARKSETKEQQTSGKKLTLFINRIMQTKEYKSDGKAYFATITLANKTGLALFKPIVLNHAQER